MESSKDKALKAKQIAEMKFTQTADLLGAKKFALISQNLDPSLDGIACLIATLDVHIAASKRIHGDEVNWYAVLGVEPTANVDTIRRCYRRLALAIYPDKNKSEGAHEAFKLISEAVNVLCNPSKRVAFDQKCGIQPAEVNNNSRKKNGFHDFMGLTNSSSSSRLKNQTGFPNLVSPSPPPSKKDDETFWTTCVSCSTKYEYKTSYRSCLLLCPSCYVPFKATEVPAPSKDRNSSWNYQRQQLLRKNQFEVPTKSNVSQRQSSISSPITTLSQLSGGGRSMEAQLKGTTENSQKKIMQIDGNTRNLEIFKPLRCESNEDSQFQAKKASMNTGKFGISGVHRRDLLDRIVRPLNLQSALLGKAKMAIGQSYKGYDFTSRYNIAAGPSKKGKSMKESNANKRPRGIHLKSRVGESSSSSSLPNLTNDLLIMDDKSVSPLTTMSVPDPDFHNFDKDRTETSFKENQIWAAYDDDDGMPRFYAMIHSVVSEEPFKLSISWLNSKSNDELGPMNWINSGFYKTSGNFSIEKSEFNTSLNSFSHKVKWTRDEKGVLQIYPKTGDVWAIYRNWSPNWNNSTPEEVIRKYDMVEVLEDFHEKKGLKVWPLVKVVGFKTVFQRHSSKSSVITFQKEEIFRFSHQVPSHLLLDQQIDNALKGCLELDPAAMPSELLQVLTKEEVEEMENRIVQKKEEQFQKMSGKEVSSERHRADSEKNIIEETMSKVAEVKTVKKVGTKVYKRRNLRKKKLMDKNSSALG